MVCYSITEARGWWFCNIW